MRGVHKFRKFRRFLLLAMNDSFCYASEPFPIVSLPNELHQVCTERREIYASSLFTRFGENRRRKISQKSTSDSKVSPSENSRVTHESRYVLCVTVWHDTIFAKAAKLTRTS